MGLDLQSLFGLHVHLCTAVRYSLAETSYPHPPAFGLIYEGAIGQPRLTTSLCDHLVKTILVHHGIVNDFLTELLAKLSSAVVHIAQFCAN
jgi:hypothetical protein